MEPGAKMGTGGQGVHLCRDLSVRKEPVMHKPFRQMGWKRRVCAAWDRER